MIKIFYRLFRKQILKIYYSEQTIKQGFENMKVQFVDSEGRRYFSPDKDLDLPHIRTQEIQRRLMRTKFGLDDEYIDDFIKAVKGALNNGKKPDVAMIGHLINELEARSQIWLHPDMMFDMVAFKYIREDETPAVIDKNIHDQKVAQFAKDSKEGLYDFFYKAKLTDVLPFLKLLESEFPEFWQESIVQLKAKEIQIKDYITRLNLSNH